jgi:hypothetical protein
MEEKIINKEEEDKKEKIIANTGYWDVPKDIVKKKLEQDSIYEKSLKTFMRLHQKQISEIMRKW